MKTEKIIKLFLVDDDALFLKSLEMEFNEQTDFKAGTYSIETYPTGELCIANLSHNPDVIILDYYLNGIDEKSMNGLETLDKIKAQNPDIPVVMLSSQDKIEADVQCMHHKAFDYVEKNEKTFLRLQKIIMLILQHKKIEKELSWYMERM